jgi:hypothetical protein
MDVINENKQYNNRIHELVRLNEFISTQINAGDESVGWKMILYNQKCIDAMECEMQEGKGLDK